MTNRQSGFRGRASLTLAAAIYIVLATAWIAAAALLGGPNGPAAGGVLGLTAFAGGSLVYWLVVVASARPPRGTAHRGAAAGADGGGTGDQGVAPATPKDGHFRALFDHNPDSVYCIDTTGHFVEVNRAAVHRTDLSRDELIGRPFWELLPDSEVSRAQQEFRAVLAGSDRRYEGWTLDREGNHQRSVVTAVPLRVDGEIAGVWAIVKDITAARRDEDALRVTANAFDNAMEGAMIMDTDWRIRSVNRAFTRITGYTEEEVRGVLPQDIGSGLDDLSVCREIAAQLAERGDWQGEFWHRRKHGEIYPVLMTVSAVRDDEGGVTNYIALFNDISESKDYQRRLDYLANRDPLTGLANRAMLTERIDGALEHARRRGKPVALLLVDLDQFKAVNDSLGHGPGDELLRTAAERITSCVDVDDAVARLSGDEFAILLPDLATTREAAPIAERVVQTLAGAYELRGRELYLGASAGISAFPQDGTEAGELLKNAEAAMFQAKAQGRNAYQFFSADLNVRATEFLSLSSDLRRTLEEEAFTLCYQPVTELSTGRISGVEALLRWYHPDRGWVSPEVFIPAAESAGIIGEIGEWVLRRACQRARQWQEDELGPDRIAVNVSPRQFRDPHFPERLSAILDETGLPARALDLELTESMVMENFERARGTLSTLTEMGVGIALDDFGTGYSSMSYLKAFRFDFLKIDRSFIAGIPGDRSDVAIVETVLAMARSLGLRVIAEGVETGAQVRFLRKRGCREAQGFYFRPALTAEELEVLLQDTTGFDDPDAD